MTPHDFAERLLQSARKLGWDARREPDFTRPRFRGGLEDSAVDVPAKAIGLRLDAYPVLVTSVQLTTLDAMTERLEQAHNQMILARSYMASDQVLNAHIFLVVTDVAPRADTLRLFDLAQRNETVCRKMVWRPDPDNVDGSYAQFIARTFLARPWELAKALTDAPLDHNHRLVQQALVAEGLAPAVADIWVRLAEAGEHESDELVDKLVDAMEHKP